MSATTVPFAARAATLPAVMPSSLLGVTWDTGRQINVNADGTPWYTSDLAASTTDTNLDGKSDETADPYYAPAS